VTSLYILVPISLAMVLAMLFVFWRALEGGQFDDLDKPEMDLLMDDDTPPKAPPGD
jgi:cbb3-type cytochrome oxidase maturation protein